LYFFNLLFSNNKSYGKSLAISFNFFLENLFSLAEVDGKFDLKVEVFGLGNSGPSAVEREREPNYSFILPNKNSRTVHP